MERFLKAVEIRKEACRECPNRQDFPLTSLGRCALRGYGLDLKVLDLSVKCPIDKWLSLSPDVLFSWFNNQELNGLYKGNLIKYLSLYADKCNIEDLMKAQHYFELLVALQKNMATRETPPIPYSCV